MDLHTIQPIHVLAKTPFWQLWRGRDELQGRNHLVKQLSEKAVGNTVYRDRLADEANFLKKHPHDRLPEYGNLDAAEGLLILGDAQCTLSQLIKRHGPFPNDIVTNVLIDCLDGLTYLEKKGIAHGSLGSHNILVDPQGRIRLGCFTGYRYQKKETPHWDKQHAPMYPAPEILEGSFGECGPWSDLYNLGHLALELLAAGDYPALFGPGYNDQTTNWPAWHTNASLSLDGWRDKVPDAAEALADLIDGLIVKAPSDRRYRSCADVLNHLRDLGFHSRAVLPMFSKHDDTPAGARAKPASEPDFRPPPRRVGPKLILRPRSGPEREITFANDQAVLVGGHDQAALPLHDPSVSNRHALLACQGRRWFVYDLASREGTRHNRHPVDHPTPLRRGDEVQFGSESFEIDLELAGTGIIRNFDLQQRIHVGQRGDLYIATWYPRPGRERRVVVRLMPPDFHMQREQVRKFLRAIPAAGRLSRHRDIVSIYKGGMCRRDDTPTWYIAMQYLPEGSLRDRLRKQRGRMPLKSIKRFATDVCRAIDAAARSDLLHRNINPACILFTADGNAKLGDFSLSRGVIVETLYDITRGDPLLTQGRRHSTDYVYRAPEVLRGADELDISCDLFSLAVCVYEALTGTIPIDPQLNNAELIGTLSEFDWPAPGSQAPGLPGEWDRFMQRALSKDAGQRYRSVAEFAEALAALPDDAGE